MRFPKSNGNVTLLIRLWIDCSSLHISWFSARLIFVMFQLSNVTEAVSKQGVLVGLFLGRDDRFMSGCTECSERFLDTRLNMCTAFLL